MNDCILVIFKDEFTNELVEREIGVMSEFWMYGDKYKADWCQRWADEKGNAQHNSILTFVSWERKEA